MITSIDIDNLKCFKRFRIELRAFNVLIGPNDSGKTAFLRLLASACQLGAFPITQRSDPRLARLPGPIRLSQMPQFAGFDLGPNIFWLGDERNTPLICLTASVNDQVREFRFRVKRVEGLLFLECVKVAGEQEWDFSSAVGRVQYVSFEPDALRAPSDITSKSPFHLGVDGAGFATFLEDLLRADRRSFFEMEKLFYERFPHYKSIEVAKKEGTNVLLFKTQAGQSLTSHEVSDGALLYLAFLSVTHRPEPPRVLLVEEPENGVHQSGLKQVISALRAVSVDRGVQVLLTTHSPFLLDLADPDEVHVFTKDNEGAVSARRLSNFEHVDEMTKDFRTGEIWSLLSPVAKI